MLTAVSAINVDMAVFNEAASTIFVDVCFFIFKAVNNPCVHPRLFLEP